MAYDEQLETRVSALMRRWRGFQSKKMFGGVGYLKNGNMAFGIWRDSLVVRCGPDRYEDCLSMPHVREFDVTGRAMTGWVLVAPEGLQTDDALRAWITCGKDFSSTLPAK